MPVFHITEDRITALVPAEVYESQVGLAEMALDTDAIGDAIRRVRSRVHGAG